MARSSYLNHITDRKTPQSEKAKEGQVKNLAGGYVFKVDDWTRLQRVLILGNPDGTYYASERSIALEHFDVVKRCSSIDYKRTINTIVEISDQGRAFKNDSAIFALAVCSVFGSKESRTYANKMVPKVARYSTALFSYVFNVLSLKENKKGKGLHRSIGRWYTEKDVEKLAYQVCKYPQRSIEGKKIGHGDLLKIARICPKRNNNFCRNGKVLTIPSKEHEKLFQYAIYGLKSNENEKGIDERTLSLWKEDPKFKYVWAHEKAKKVNSSKEIVNLINEYKLTRESISPEFINKKEIQKALLPHMPLTALIRNLGGMTSSGLLKPLSDEVDMVIEKISNEEYLKNSRIHPMTIIQALKIYKEGRGIRTSWSPVPQIVDALDDSFYKSFNYIEPTGKKYLLGIDVSASMNWSVDNSDSSLTSAEAAAVIAMCIARLEKKHLIMGFSEIFKDLKIRKSDSLSTVLKKTSDNNFGSTDCSLPMQYALDNDLDVDVFVVLTDSETWCGRIHPFEALKKYRKKKNKDAKLAVLAFEASDISIADPSDSGMIDIAGLDSNVPIILSEFAKGNL